MSDFIDVREYVLNRQVKVKQQAVYLERLGGWFTIRELMGDEKGEVLNNSINQKTGRVDIKVMYAELFVRSLHYPDPDCPPEQPIKPDPIPDNFSERDQAKYDKSLAQYNRDKQALTHPYTYDHPHAGELVFQPLDRDAMNKAMPGEVLELVAEPAMALNGFNKEDLEDEKKDLRGTVIDSTLTTSRNGSATSIPI